MRVIDHTGENQWTAASGLASPFAEITPSSPGSAEAIANVDLWPHATTPFAELRQDANSESVSNRLYADSLAELRDEGFDEAVTGLAEETEQSIYDRFGDETPSSSVERERFAETQLSTVRFEAEQYLNGLEADISGLDINSLTLDQLDEVLNRHDVTPGQLTPAGEDFIGAIAQKAKRAVKIAANAGRQIGTIGSKLLAPVLQKLRSLIKPLLLRVLSFAIGRLPAPLQPAARTLAARFTSESGEDSSLDEENASPATLTDLEMLTLSFDEALAETIAERAEGEPELEFLEEEDRLSGDGGRQLEHLAEARGALVDTLGISDNREVVAAAVEEFVPALLGALRLGIRLAGRPKVVSYLARYLAKSIDRWIGPTQLGPLSNAIVDTGLKLASLETEKADIRQPDPAGAVALASVAEDTIRLLAEQADFVLDNEDLMQLAASEAFSQAVASHFPSQFVRPALQQAPSLGGTFVARSNRSVRPFSKYSRVPIVEITERLADALPSFGGSTVGDFLRAKGARFPIQARIHIYQAKVGTNLPRIARIDKVGAVQGLGGSGAALMYPLTPAAAGLLLREPQLGVAVPPTYLRSRNRIAVGQRLYTIEPIGATASIALRGGSARPGVGTRSAPTHSWIAINRHRRAITVGFYLSEVDSQQLAELVRKGRGGSALLQALVAAFRGMSQRADRSQGHARLSGENWDGLDDFTARDLTQERSEHRTLLQQRINGWVLPALAAWTRNNVEAFSRAAAHPSSGVTIRVQLTSVPGLGPSAGNSPGKLRGRGVSSSPIDTLRSYRGTPDVTITVTPGKGRP